MSIKYSVGLDVASKKIDICMSVIDCNQKVTVVASTSFPNTLKGFQSMDEWIVKKKKLQEIPLVMCMEATGVYHENCALYFSEKKYAVSIILPNKAKHYLISLGLKSKNDSIDAKGLSKMGAEQCLELWQPMGKLYYELRQYTRQYQNLQDQKTVINNQLHALENSMYMSEMMINQQKAIIELFNEQLKELEKLMKNLINSDQVLKQKVDNICKIKGIALLSVSTIIAETNGFELFKNYKQLVSYAGFDVVERESGMSVGKTKISKKGNSRIRRALFMPAFVAIKYKEKPLVSLYERTFAKHGIKMKSYVAVQKKQLVLIYHIWKKNEPYNPDYKKDSPEMNSEAIQDNSLKSGFSEVQNYEKKEDNETKDKKKEKIHSHCEVA
ncbi:Transposase IS110 family [Flavobacterium branchiophilum FL-15]|uniref:Transposase IS110 family n=1 Tax=Flavobacterium branchiophilum (strain FL-15) TaxID=1034807 RepID=G2Z0G9_FLABF|nr:IS110 family transposase [Flavobacterium branchiophilum]CCB69360.1 Transposase IS110 family [Flavobacterium branchiophilum FL-15]CCB69776.1 Transposase IS110 family [Flavobacterium branchiophilum FL-15]